MSDREKLYQLLDTVPDNKVAYIIGYIQGLTVGEDEPNAETLEAFAEIENGGGHRFSGKTEELFTELMED